MVPASRQATHQREEGMTVSSGVVTSETFLLWLSNEPAPRL